MDELSGFKLFLGQLAQTNATLDYFTDFEKIRSHIQPIEIKLNTLNYLLGKENLDTAIRQLYHENPKVFEVLGILIAIRESKKTKVLNHDLQAVSLSSFFNSPEHIIEYIGRCARHCRGRAH